METQKQKPLYKRLNEVRTQGKWDKQGPKTQIDGQTYYTIHVPGTFDAVGFFYPRSDKDGNMNMDNIDYINLSVNNFHAVVEALEEIAMAYEACAKLLTGVSNPNPPILLKAKEALSKIS